MTLPPKAGPVVTGVRRAPATAGRSGVAFTASGRGQAPGYFGSALEGAESSLSSVGVARQ